MPNLSDYLPTSMSEKANCELFMLLIFSTFMIMIHVYIC